MNPSLGSGRPLGGEGQVGGGPRLGLRGPEAGGCRQLVTLPSSLGQASWGPAGLLFMQGGQGLGEAGEAQSRQVPSVIAFGHLKGIV